MDREDLRALAQSALNEFATEFATSERPRRLWQETKSGVYFDESAVVGVLEMRHHMPTKRILNSFIL